MFGVRAARVGFSFSLLLAVVASWAMTHEELLRRLESAKTPAQVNRALEEAKQDLNSDDELWNEVVRVESSGSALERLERLKAMLRTRIIAERSAPKPDFDPAKFAREIKASPAYYDPGAAKSSNWIARAFQRLGEWLERIRVPERRIDTPDVPAVGGWGDALIKVVWFVLAAGVLAFLIWAARTFSWKIAKRKKKIAGLLEEDEPERTADEWLTRADELEAEGRHREAVRCLYLACLVRIDEANVARFVRSETNWEHLARIDASPRRPAGLDFRTPTQRFDVIWYGFLTQGAPDVEYFRQTYRSLCEVLNLQKSA
jgi:hypothetical protein